MSAMWRLYAERSPVASRWEVFSASLAMCSIPFMRAVFFLSKSSLKKFSSFLSMDSRLLLELRRNGGKGSGAPCLLRRIGECSSNVRTSGPRLSRPSRSTHRQRRPVRRRTPGHPIREKDRANLSQNLSKNRDLPFWKELILPQPPTNCQSLFFRVFPRVP